MPDTQTMLKRTTEKQLRFRAQMAELLEEAYDADKSEQRDLTAEQSAKHVQICAGWRESLDEHAMFSERTETERIDAEKEDLVSAPGVAAKRAKANASVYNTLLQIGRGEYRGDAPSGGVPDQYEMPIPAISRGSDGKNHVHPFPAIFGGANKPADIEAAYRNYEIIRAGKTGQYDPATGKRLFEGDLTTDSLSTDGDAIPDIATDMYMYMITRNVLAQYMTIHQTPGINSLVVTQRRTVPNAAVYGDRSNSGQGQLNDIPILDPTYATTKLDSLAYAAIIQYAYVMTTVTTPWDFASTVAEDGGIALANGFGAHCATGDGGSTQAAGCQAFAAEEVTVGGNATFPYSYTGVASSTAFAGAATATFDIKQLFNWFGAMAIPYYNNPDKVIVSNLETWLSLLSVRDLDGFPVLLNSLGSEMPNSILGIPVVLDQNMPAVAMGEVPMIVGDLRGHAVHYAGGPRVDFSSEYGFGKDKLSYRFIQHADAANIDINSYRGYKFT